MHPQKNLKQPVLRKKYLRFAGFFLAALCCAFLFTGENRISPGRAAASQSHPPRILVPSADGAIVYESELVSVDASHTDEGYVMVRYMGKNPKVKLQLEMSGGQTYTYLLSKDQIYEAFPFSSGDGIYSLRVYEQIKDDSYTLIFSEELAVTLQNEFLPFLYPNQYISFTSDSLAASISEQLCKDARSDAEAIGILYRYVCRNISYDMEKAAQAAYGYLPDVDEILTSGKGICFDYAAVLTAMLRSRGIPAKLEVGYAGDAFHAWVSVYSEEAGRPDSAVRLREKAWNLLDPTLAAHSGSAGANAYIGDGSHYTVKYSY